MNRVTGGDLPAAIFHDVVGRALPLLAKRRAPTALAASQPRSDASGTSPVGGAPGRSANPRGVPKVLDTATLAF